MNLKSLMFIFLGISIERHAYGLTLKTMRHPLCGVDFYQERRDPACGVETYFEKRTEACGVEHYNSRQDWSCPGSVLPSIPPYVPGAANICLDAECTGQIDICEKPEFGVALYKLCRHSDHGVENYLACRLPPFGVGAYKSCSFYKTPEELDAYLKETVAAAETYKSLLPLRLADLLVRLGSEIALKCMVSKYESIPGYEDVYEDLAEKFFIAFGYNANDVDINCDGSASADVAAFEREPKLTIDSGTSSLHCQALSPDSLAVLDMPPGVTPGHFLRFKQICSNYLAHQVIVNWFSTKSTELDLLASDLAATKDSYLSTQIASLKATLKATLSMVGQ